MSHIETSDRGITISKSLAWTMIAGLIGAGVWMGSNLSGTKTLLETISTQQGDARDERLRLEARLRAVEASRASDAVELSGLRRDLTEFRAELRDVAALLRRVGEP